MCGSGVRRCNPSSQYAAYMAKSRYGPYLSPSVSVSKSRMRVCLGQYLCDEFCICILLFTHPNKNACGVWGALCTLHLYLVSVSCIWAAIRTLYPVSRIRIPYLGLIPYPVSRIPYPYPVFGAHSVSEEG